VRSAMFSTMLAAFAAVSGLTLIKDDPRNATLPTQVVALSDLVDTAAKQSDQQFAKLTEQLGQVVDLLVAQQQEVKPVDEGLRGAIQEAERGNREVAEKIDKVVEGFRGVQSVTEEQREEVKRVVNGLGAKIAKLEGNAENFDTLSERVTKLEEELKLLKMRSIVEPKTAEKTTTPSTGTTTEIVYPYSQHPVYQSYSGNSSGSRVSNTTYYPSTTYYPPMSAVETPVVIPVQSTVYNPPVRRYNSTASGTCRTVWDRTSRSWVQVCR
jgi:hypothetical protein